MRTEDITKDEVKKYLKVHYDFNVRLWERHLLQNVVDEILENLIKLPHFDELCFFVNLTWSEPDYEDLHLKSLVREKINKMNLADYFPRLKKKLDKK